MLIKLKRLHKDAKVPTRGTMFSAASDLYAVEDVELSPGNVGILSCGWAFEIPPDYYVEIVPRSGLACKKEVIILNSPCIIDSDYRGEIKTYAKNVGTELVKIKVGERYAQMILKKVLYTVFNEINELSKTNRGSGGFGSTGK